MKKWLKLWILATAVVAASSFVLTQVSADPAPEVRVVIEEWQNSCALSGYDFWTISASATDTVLSGIDNDLTCTLLKSASWDINAQLTNLVGNADSGHVISGSNFTITTTPTANTYSWSLTSHATTALNDAVASNNTNVLYSKEQYKVWTIVTAKVTLEGVVNAWQEVDTYQGQLNITVPNS